MPLPDVIIKTLVTDNKRGGGGEKRNFRTVEWERDGA